MHARIHCAAVAVCCGGLGEGGGAANVAAKEICQISDAGGGDDKRARERPAVRLTEEWADERYNDPPAAGITHTDLETRPSYISQ